MRRAAVMVLVLGLVAVGCDGGTGEPTTVPTTVAPASTVATATTVAPTTTEAATTAASGPLVWDVVALGDSY